jgi:hypothetical protein
MSAVDAGRDVFVGDGPAARRMRSIDWAATPLGPVSGWPHSLKVVVRILLTSRYAMWLGWGKAFTFFCNDAYRPTLGNKDEWAIGASARDVWAEIWDDIGPRADSVIRTGQATWDEALQLFLERSGFKEETYHTFSYSPVPDDSGGIGGMLCVVTEVTERVIGERRSRCCAPWPPIWPRRRRWRMSAWRSRAASTRARRTCPSSSSISSSATAARASPPPPASRAGTPRRRWRSCATPRRRCGRPPRSRAASAPSGSRRWR